MSSLNKVAHWLVPLLLAVVGSAVPEFETCPGRTLISNTTQGRISIVRPGQKHASQVTCDWMIQAPAERPFITLTAVQFSTECSFDFVYLYEGCEPESRRQLAVLSGDLYSMNVRSFVGKDCLLVHFVSDLDYTREGFVFDFRTDACPARCLSNRCSSTGGCLCDATQRGPNCQFPASALCLGENVWSGDSCTCRTGYAGFNCSLALGTGTPESVEGVWHSLTTSASARVLTGRAFSSAVVTLDSGLYVFGGRTLNASLGDLLRLSLPNASSWEILSPRSGVSPSPRHGHAMWGADKYVYVYGGTDLTSGKVFAELWRFSTVDSTWTNVSLPHNAPALVYHSATLVGSEVLLVGGQTQSGGINPYMYKLSVSPVNVVQDRPRFGISPAVTGHTAVFHPDLKQLVVFAGFDNTNDGLLAVRSNTIHVFSVDTRVWTKVIPDKTDKKSSVETPVPRAFHSATLVGDVMVVAGGSVHLRSSTEVCKAGANGTLHYYDLSCHRWRSDFGVRKDSAGKISLFPSGDLPPGRFGHSAVLLRGHILLLLNGFSGEMLDRLDAYVLPSVIARAQDSTVTAAAHCRSQKNCTGDWRCASCRISDTDACLPLSAASSSALCVSPSCPGPCPRLPSCIDCLAHSQCAWCSQLGKCIKRDAAIRCLDVPNSWWNVTQRVVDIGQCPNAAPRAGAFVSYHMPPANTTLPDQVLFTDTLNPVSLHKILPWANNVTDPMVTSGGEVMEYVVRGSVSPVRSRTYRSIDGVLYPLQAVVVHGHVNVSMRLSTDDTTAALRQMKNLTGKGMIEEFGLTNPFPSGSSKFYLYNINIKHLYTKFSKLSSDSSSAVLALNLKWYFGDNSLVSVDRSYLRPQLDSSVCLSLPSCLSCVTNAACGWCRSARICQTRTGNEHCVSPLEEVISMETQCPGCSDHGNCGDCTLDPNCEWYPPASSCIRRGRFSNTSLTRRDQCPPKCTDLSKCKDCLTHRECVWCDTTSSCYPFAWQVWNLAGDCAAWRFRGVCKPACNATTCSDCLVDNGCAWCHDPDKPQNGTCTAQACPANRTRAYYECPPINECELGLDTKCKANSTCVDQRHGYRCECDPGFEGDGEVLCERTCYPACVHGRCSGSPDYTCICDLGFTGQNCSQDCGCNRHANCSAGVGFCDECYNGTVGDHCERCLLGYFGNASHPAGCAPCSCHGHGIPPQLCDSQTGDCRCQHNTRGRECDSCLPGHHGTPTIADQPCYATCQGRRLLTNLTTGYTGYIGLPATGGAGRVLHCHWLIDARPAVSSMTTTPPAAVSTTPSPAPGTDSLILVQFTSLDRLACLRGGIYFHDRGGNFSMALPVDGGETKEVGLLAVVCDRVLDTVIESRSGLLGVYFLYEQRSGETAPGFAFNFTLLRCPDCGFNRTCREGVCQCAPGRSGMYCERQECPNNCSGANGVCKAGACQCVYGWTGNDCSQAQGSTKGPTVSVVTNETPERFGHTLVTCDGEVLMFGGETSEGVASDHLYKLAEPAWIRLPCSDLCPPAMSWHAAACDDFTSDPAMLVIGPTDGGLWRYQVRSGRWSRVSLNGTELSGGVFGHSLTLLNDARLALVGGFRRKDASKPWSWNEDVFLFKRSGDSTLLPVSGQLPAGVFGHAAATGTEMPDLLFILGGFHASRTTLIHVSLVASVQSPEPTVSSDVYALKLSTGQWFLMPAARVVGTPPPAHAFAAAVRVGHSQWLVHGGVGSDGKPLSEKMLRVYDLYCNVWSEANIDWRNTDQFVRNFSMAFGARLAEARAKAKEDRRFLLVGGALAGTVSRLSLAIEQLSGSGGLSLRCETCQCTPAVAQVQDCAAQPSCRHCRAASVLPEAQFGVRGRECVWCGNCDPDRAACRNGSSCGAACTFAYKGSGPVCPAEETCGFASTCTSCRKPYPRCEWSRRVDMCNYVLNHDAKEDRTKGPAPTCLAEGCKPAQPCPACVAETAPCVFAAGKRQCHKETVLPMECAGGRCGGVFQQQCPNLNNCSGVEMCAGCLGVPGCGWVATNPDSQDGLGRCLQGGFAGPAHCDDEAVKAGCGRSEKHWAFSQCPPENECENGHHNCDKKVEKCVDQLHGFVCVCKEGYERINSKCEPKCDNGCNKQQGTCIAPNVCKCNFGFVGSDCNVKCECNGNSECEGPSREQRKKCVSCIRNTMGNQCQYCKPQFVGDPTQESEGLPCKPCREFCYGHSDKCAIKTADPALQHRGPTKTEAQCVNCANATMGDQCQECKEGYFRLTSLQTDPCQPCQCNGHSATCDKGTGAACSCHNNTRSDEKCSKPDTVRTTPNLRQTCYRNQCSSCKEYFLGKPIKGRQCYMRMSMERKYCFDLFHSQAQCGLKPHNPLPLGKAVFFVVQPKYMNVDIRVIVDMLEGEVDVYISSESQRFVVTNDPDTWQHRVSIEPALQDPAGSTLSRRRRSVVSDVREVVASPIVTHVRLDTGKGVLLVRRVSRRLIVFVSRSEHNLKSHRFYLIFRGAAVKGAQALVVFRQDQVHIDLFVFFSVFFACFFLLLGAFIVGWKCKQVMDFRRSMEREARARQTMASRPFARVYVALDRRPLLLSRDEEDGAAHRLPPIAQTNHPPPGPLRREAEFSPVPVAVEPTDDGIACVGTLLIQVPGPVVALGSGLMTMRVMYPSGKQAAGGLRRRVSVSAC